MTHDRSGLLNIAGTQLGFAVCIAIVLAGLASPIEAMGILFGVVGLAGAAYLVWLGWNLLHSSGTFETAEANSSPSRQARLFRIDRLRQLDAALRLGRCGTGS
jgi:threonine/homoserine/homoserine lactone efflux protein